MINKIIYSVFLTFTVASAATGTPPKPIASPAKENFTPLSGGLTSRIIGTLEIPEKPGLAPIKLYVSPTTTSTPLFSDAKSSDFISVEHDYELRSVATYEKRNDWYRVATARGDAWIQAARAGKFRRYEDLVGKGLNYLTPEWDRKLYSSPGTKPRSAKVKSGVDHFSAKVLEKKGAMKNLWFKVRLINDACEDDEPEFTDEGWVPAIGDKNQIYMWFFARGC
jgi:hypothetical protein